MTEKWYCIPLGELEKKLGTSFSSGLTSGEAKTRITRYGKNEIYNIPTGSLWPNIKRLLTDLTTILLVITALLAAIFNHDTTAWIMIGLVVLNFSAVLLSYYLAQRIFYGMGRNSLPSAKVLRRGTVRVVNQSLLVPGDIICIGTGDIIPADARLIESDSLTVLETKLTGERHSSEKNAVFAPRGDMPLQGRRNMVYAGSIVTNGTARAVVCDTGKSTLINALGENNIAASHEKLGILNTLRDYCKKTGTVMVALIFALMVLDLIFNIGGDSEGLFDIFLTATSLAVAAMTEFYTVFGYIIIACGLKNADKHYKDIISGATVRNAASLPMLRDLTSVIVSKEALLSVRLAKIDKIYVNCEMLESSDRKWKERTLSILRYAVISTGIYGSAKLQSNNLSNDNVYSSEEESILYAADSAGVYNSSLEKVYPIIDHQGISRINIFETTLTRFGENNVVVMRGEAAPVLACCRYYSKNGRIHRMTDEMLNEFLITASQTVKQAYRVIAVATCDTKYENLSRIKLVQTNMIFEGFVCIREPLLPGCALNIERCKNAGIKVIMTCDSESDNNRFIAAALGIITADRECTTGAEFLNLKPGLLEANVPMYRLYQGMDSDTTKYLIEKLQESGEKVGVLTGSLNDINLVQSADAGFAQSVTVSHKNADEGIDLQKIAPKTERSKPLFAKNPNVSSRTGCEAVKFVSDVIISEPDSTGSGGFNAIAGAMSCGRVIYRNINRALRYLIASQFARLLIVLCSVVSGITLLTPLQLLFSGLVLDFGAVIVIAFERPANDILSLRTENEDKLERPLINNFEYILFGLLWAAVTVFTPLVFSLAGHKLTSEQITSAVFVSFTLTQLSSLSEIKRDKSIFRSLTFNGIHLLYILVTVGIVVFGQLFPSFGNLFGMVMPDAKCLVISLIFPVFTLISAELYRYISSKTGRIKLDPDKFTVSAIREGKFFSSGFRVKDIDDDELYSTVELNAVSSEDTAGSEKSEENGGQPSETDNGADEVSESSFNNGDGTGIPSEEDTDSEVPDIEESEEDINEVINFETLTDIPVQSEADSDTDGSDEAAVNTNIMSAVKDRFGLLKDVFRKH